LGLDLKNADAINKKNKQQEILFARSEFQFFYLTIFIICRDHLGGFKLRIPHTQTAIHITKDDKILFDRK